MPSGTQSNLIGVMTHCARGDEVILGQEAHNYRYEAGGGAALGSVQPQPLDNAADGTIPIAAIEAAIKPEDSHFAKTRLIALENTIGGKVLPDGLRRHGASARRSPASRAPSRRRAPVERRGEAGRRAARDGGRVRFGVGVPVQGAGRAGRIAAVRRARLHQGGAAVAQDAGWRDAAGGGSRGGRTLRDCASHRAPRRGPRQREHACRGPRAGTRHSPSRRRRPT